MRARRILAAVAMVAAATAGAVVTQAGPASADTTLCDQYAQTTIDGGAYIVQNNRWGTTATQCISVNSTGFKIIQEDGVKATNGGPTSYPSTVWGCHYAACTPGFSPVPGNQIAGINTSVSMSYPAGGNWDAAYDIWLDPTARITGQNTGAEIMVWVNHSGPPQPVGSRVATVSLAGSTWDVWYGNSGWNVISYVQTSGTGSISFPVSTFVNDSISRGYARSSWYLTSIQAGFEPWSGGTGLALNSFSVTRGNPTATTAPATTRPPATTTPTTTAPPVTTRPPASTATAPATTAGGGSAGCRATATIGSSWSGGFTANVTVTNTGSAPITGWKVSWGWAGGQTLQGIWNASGGASGSTVTASNAAYNGRIAAGGSTSFGFQAVGAATTPAISCTAS